MIRISRADGESASQVCHPTKLETLPGARRWADIHLGDVLLGNYAVGDGRRRVRAFLDFRSWRSLACAGK